MFDSIIVQTAAESANIQTLIYTILLSFILSSMLAMVYLRTVGGADYSKTYIQSIILISLISTIIIQAIGDSLARGLGIMAAMAIIRFRTNLKDPRDLLFLFASLAAGISCGSYSFDIAIVGTIGFSLAVIVLHLTPLGSDKHIRGLLSFSLAIKENEKRYLDRCMSHYCHSSSLKEIKDTGNKSNNGSNGERFAYIYNINLKHKKNYETFLRDLKRLPSIKNIKLRSIK